MNMEIIFLQTMNIKYTLTIFLTLRKQCTILIYHNDIKINDVNQVWHSLSEGGVSLLRTIFQESRLNQTSAI